MASVSDIAKGFTISGLIDADARTRERFRVVEIPVAEIADHPANVTYSMDAEGIRRARQKEEVEQGAVALLCAQEGSHALGVLLEATEAKILETHDQNRYDKRKKISWRFFDE